VCAPHRARDARAAIVGLTLESGKAQVVRAGVEAMAYQTRDNVDVMVASGMQVPELKVDGGAARSDVLCQFQADLLGIPVARPTELERTALGVAHLAGTGVGLWGVEDITRAVDGRSGLRTGDLRGSAGGALLGVAGRGPVGDREGRMTAAPY
jgi:glycerol kinase